MTCARRDFLAGAAAVGALVLAGRAGFAGPTGRASDEEVFLEALRYAREAGWSDLPIGDVLARMGQRFLGAPYVGHTLEAHGPEHLVVNLREFDCTTFIESMLTIARCVKLPAASYADFQWQLRFIRYRSGILDGYPSRLHYFTDWLADNARKGVASDLTRELGGTKRSTRISFMSDHPESYRQLADTTALEAIRSSERRLTGMERWYIPRERVRDIEDGLRDGDLIGITTSVEGLDVAHTGMIAVRSGRPAFLHASLSAGKVVLADGTLSTYLRTYRTHDGVMVARPREPEPNE